MSILTITTTYNTCSHCGRVVHDGIGLNGRHLCGACCDDKAVLDTFMAEASRVVRDAAGLLMHYDLGGGRR